MNRTLVEPVIVRLKGMDGNSLEFTLPVGTIVRDTGGRDRAGAEIQWASANAQGRSRLYAMVPESALGPSAGQSLEDMWNGRPVEL